MLLTIHENMNSVVERFEIIFLSVLKNFTKTSIVETILGDCDL